MVLKQKNIILYNFCYMISQGIINDSYFSNNRANHMISNVILKINKNE